MNAAAESSAAAADLTRADAHHDPIVQFARWFEQAGAAGILEPNAMGLATAAKDAMPTLRTVLLKDFDENGFVFFTNHSSRKARQMHDNPAVCALFAWIALYRQVSIEGKVDRLSADESAVYFHTRPRHAQLGAWASRQSETLVSRQVLETRLAVITERFRDREVALPDFWGGYRIRPARMEFWQGRPHRLHDRLRYTRADDGWQMCRLSP